MIKQMICLIIFLQVLSNQARTQSVKHFIKQNNYTKAISDLRKIKYGTPNKEHDLELATAHYKRAQLFQAMYRQFHVLASAYFAELKESKIQNAASDFYRALTHLTAGESQQALRLLRSLPGSQRARGSLWLQASKAIFAGRAATIVANNSTPLLGVESQFLQAWAGGEQASFTFKNMGKETTTEFLAETAWLVMAAGHREIAYDYLELLLSNRSADDSVNFGKHVTIRLYNPFTFHLLAETDYRFAIHYFHQIEDEPFRKKHLIDYFTGLAYLEIKNAKQALQHLSNSVAANYLIYRAAALYSLGRKSEAAKMWRTLQSHKSPRVRSELAKVRAVYTGQFQQNEALASEALVQVKKSGRDRPVYYQNAGWVQHLAGHHEKAVETYNDGYDYSNHNNLDVLDPVYLLEFNIVRFSAGKRTYADVLGALYAIQKKYPLAKRLYTTMQALATPANLNIGDAPTQ